MYFLQLQEPLKGHKYTHAENEVQADDDDDDETDDDDDGFGWLSIDAAMD